MEKRDPWDPLNARTLFPAYQEEPLIGLAYLDTAATSQRLGSALQAEMDFYKHANGNARRGAHLLAEKATGAHEAARAKVARFCHVDPSQVIFTSSATYGLNLVADGASSLVELKPGRTILVSELEHHSNFLPWMQLAKKTGATFETLKVDEDGVLLKESIERTRGSDVAILAITALSNVTGMAPPVRALVTAAKSVGALTVVDASQAVAHGDFPDDLWGADFVVFSAHKLYATLGTGVVIGHKERLEKMEPSILGGGMIATLKESETGEWSARWSSAPARFEAGTANTASVVALGAALDEMASWNRAALLEHEKALTTWTAEQLKRIPGVKVIGIPNQLEGLVSFHTEWAHAHDISSILDAHQVCVRVGHHCAIPLMRSLGIAASVRASFGPYSSWNDARRLIEGVMDAQRRFK